MITIELLCTGKSSRLENTEVITEVAFQPTNTPTVTHAVGAVIGVPNPAGLPNLPKVMYNLISGALVVAVMDTAEADQYKIGETYNLGLTAVTVKSKGVKSKAKE